MRTNLGSLPHCSGLGMAILDGQVKVATIPRGPSKAIVKNQLEAIAASIGPSMAILDGQIEVVMISRWPGMTIFDGPIKVIVLSRLSTSRSGWTVSSMVGSLFRGRDTSSFVSAFAEAVVPLFKDTWCLGKWHANSDRAPLMLGQHAYHIRVYDASFYQDCDCWFKFLKRLLIPTVDLVSEPPVVDSYWTWSNGLHLILLGLITWEIFPYFSIFYHLLSISFSIFFLRASISYSLLPSVPLLWRMYGGVVAMPPPIGLLFTSPRFFYQPGMPMLLLLSFANASTIFISERSVGGI